MISRAEYERELEAIDAAREARYARARGKHYVYVLSGPGGTYVGCSRRPEHRRREHFRVARAPSHPLEQAVHRAMRVDGADSWTFEIVAEALGSVWGHRAEVELIQQLRREGACVLNVYPETEWDFYGDGMDHVPSEERDRALARELQAAQQGAN